MRNRTSAQLAAAVAKFIIGQPYPVRKKDICAALGLRPRATDHITPYVDEFMDAGLVYVAGWSEQLTPLFAWQAVPYENADVARPLSQKEQARLRGEFRRSERQMYGEAA
jgi:hypothetical protein